MTDRFEDLPALGQLRRDLQEAALRERPAVAAARRRFWRPRRWGIALAFALVAAGGATATSLLSTGSPVRQLRGQSDRYRPKSAAGVVVSVTAPDRAGAPPWGVGVYESRSGQECAIPGQLRGEELGRYSGGTFHAFGAGVSGVCGSLTKRTPQFHDLLYVQHPARTILFGRVLASHITLTIDGQSHEALTGHGGAFIFLLKGRVTPAGFQLKATG